MGEINRTVRLAVLASGLNCSGDGVADFAAVPDPVQVRDWLASRE